MPFLVLLSPKWTVSSLRRKFVLAGWSDQRGLMMRWARFVSLQDTYNLLGREEEREMLPLCTDEGMQTIVYSPLARGVLARPWGETTPRSESEAAAGHKDETNAESDQKIVEAVAAIAKDRGVSQASIALAWLRSKPVVAAPIVGTLKVKHIDDAIVALSVSLRDEEVARLELPYTPRMDFQGVSDPVLLARAVEAATGFKASAA
jgi:aryl-alcohol dehydrogenase-like predicted oxidoreductase